MAELSIATAAPCSASVLLTRARAFALAIGIITLTLIMLWLSASRTGLLVCDTDCGETLLAINAANSFAQHGVEFGLLENLHSHAWPVLYIHNVNIGSLTFTLLEALGLHAIEQKMLLPFAVYGLGLFYVFLTARQFSKSDLAAIVILVNFAIVYWAVGSFASNALRSWHTLAYFAVVFHAASLTRSRWHVAGLFFGALIAFGCGYDFWLICGASAGFLLLFNSNDRCRSIVIAGVAFAVPFIARQVHVAAVIGPAIWWQDFIYSVAIKVPYAHRLIPIPPLADIDAWYERNRIFRPPAQPGNPWWMILFTFRHMIEFVTLPRWGFLTLFTYAGALAAALLQPLVPSFIGRFSLLLLLPLTLGAVTGLALLAPFSLHVYFKHEFPLIAFPLLLAKGITIAACLQWLKQRWTWRMAAGLIISLYVADVALTHRNNTRYGLYPNLGWIPFAATTNPAEITLAAQRLSGHAEPMIGLKQSLYTYISPHDVAKAATRYIVYQPIERIHDFDSVVPTCQHTDWISRMLGWHGKTPEEYSCIYKFPLTPQARRMPSLDEAIRLLPGYKVTDRSDFGIGYVILQRDADPDTRD